LIILNARAAEGDEGHQETNAASPGTILATAGAEGPLVATGEGLLRLLEVQPEGRRPLTGAELLRQDPGLVGTLLTAGVEPPS
jgi:methionyl-tRNA formyltransferase